VSDPYVEWKLADFTHWAVYLHENQYYLGRCYIWLKRDVVDLMDVSVTEYLELMLIANKLKRVLNQLWLPDQYNWAALGNCTPHCHLHVIPRYQQSREFGGLVFADARWGQNYVPYDKTFKLTQAQLILIRDALIRQLHLDNHGAWQVTYLDRSSATHNTVFGGFGNDDR